VHSVYKYLEMGFPGVVWEGRGTDPFRDRKNFKLQSDMWGGRACNTCCKGGSALRDGEKLLCVQLGRQVSVGGWAELCPNGFPFSGIKSRKEGGVTLTNGGWKTDGLCIL